MRGAELNTIVSYNILVHGNRMQKIENVSLHLLRLPFERDDPVEVFSQRHNGQWLQGVIYPTPTAAATISGYEVRVAGVSDVLNVPAARLRPRFPRQKPILVYEGCINGWRRAVVDTSASLDGANTEPFQFEDGLQGSWTKIPVRFTSEECRDVPSYLIRTWHASVVAEPPEGVASGKLALNPIDKPCSTDGNPEPNW